MIFKSVHSLPRAMKVGKAQKSVIIRQAKDKGTRKFVACPFLLTLFDFYFTRLLSCYTLLSQNAPRGINFSDAMQIFKITGKCSTY